MMEGVQLAALYKASVDFGGLHKESWNPSMCIAEG